MAIQVCPDCRKQRCKASPKITDPNQAQRVVITGIKLSLQNTMQLVAIFWVASFLLALLVGVIMAAFGEILRAFEG